MWIPVFIVGFLVGGAGLLLALPARWRAYTRETAVIIPVLCLLLWLLLRGQIPLLHTYTAVPLPTLTWHIGPISWPLTTWLLLLLLSTLALSVPHPSTSSPAHLLILTAFTLPTIWAGSPATMMVCWAPLLAAWGTAVWLADSSEAGRGRFLRQFAVLLTAVLLLWFGAAAANSVAWNAAAWPQTALLAVLLAALLPLGIWPLGGWRASAGTPLPTALVLSLWPLAVGGALLVRLADETEPGFLAGGMLLTLAGLFGLLWAVRQLWERLHLAETAVFFLAAALVHLLLLTAVWGNQVDASANGVLAMLRVLLLAGGICFLAARPATRRTWWRVIPPLAALAAVAGLPLTAGLAGQVALIEGVVGHGRYLVLLVVLLLQILLLTAGLHLFLPKNIIQRGQRVEAEQREEAEEEVSLSPTEWGAEAARFLPVLGLVSVSGVAWGAVSWFTWLLLLAPPVGSVILLRFVPEFQRTVAAARQVFTFRSPVSTTPLRQWLHGMGGALEEAAAILEGDGSLVWLLILILVLMSVI